MDVSIVHSGVRVRPDLIVEIAAQVDGKPIRVDLESDAIRRLLGADIDDPGAMLVSLQRRLETIRLAIKAYVFARGAPLDQYLVLSWRDLSAFVDDPTAAVAPVR
ncbi:MAG: hypothetical protein ABWY12_07120 [Burkholderiales bacterium]